MSRHCFFLHGLLQTNLSRKLLHTEELDVDTQAYISEILSKRLVELRRTEIAKRAEEAQKGIHTLFPKMSNIVQELEKVTKI